MSIKTTKEFLETKGYQVTFASSENIILRILREEKNNLVIIELDFATKDGITLTSDIKSLKNIEQPFIIIFSSKQDDYIQITALNSGADDFILLPMKPMLLEARIATLKKRWLNKAYVPVEPTKHQNFIVDKERYVIITEGRRVSLPRKEFEMLSLMYENSHKTFTRQDFARHIWNTPEIANSRTIDIHIRNIRRTLGNEIIITTKGVGYTINRNLL